MVAASRSSLGQPRRGLHCSAFHTIPETDHEEYNFMAQSHENQSDFRTAPAPIIDDTPEFGPSPHDSPGNIGNLNQFFSFSCEPSLNDMDSSKSPLSPVLAEIQPDLLPTIEMIVRSALESIPDTGQEDLLAETYPKLARFIINILREKL
jgi:hypothetical protein